MSERLAKALAIPTISHNDPARVDAAGFAALHRHLRESFPRTHQEMTVEAIGNRFCLLYTWPGSEPELQPWLAISHQDVVPIEAGTEADWTYPPFGGVIADDCVWGRGAIDVKVTLIGLLEAVEQLIESGFTPRQTVYLAFGADEELGGQNGAALIAAELEARGIRLAATLDEGGIILKHGHAVPRAPLAVIGTAQKGEARFQLTIRGEGGHSSLPTSAATPSVLAKAISRLDRHEMPARIDGATEQFLFGLMKHAGIPVWLARGVLRLSKPVVGSLMALNQSLNASVRSTIAITKVSAGGADNVVPQLATVELDARLKPGDTTASAANHIRGVLRNLPTEIQTVFALEASRVTSVETPFYECITDAIADVAPDALAVPYLTYSDTDSHHYERISDAQYRFFPVRLSPADLTMIHGTNERIRIDNYAEIVAFFKTLFRNVSESDLHIVAPNASD